MNVVGGPYFKVYVPAKAGISDGRSLFSDKSSPDVKPNSSLLTRGFIPERSSLKLSIHE